MKHTKSGEALDWAMLFQAFAEAFEWALDRAADLARNYPEEVAAVERVRMFMRKHVAGQTAHVRVDDVLFTFGLVMGALEREKVTPLVPRHRLPAKRSGARTVLLPRSQSHAPAVCRLPLPPASLPRRALPR